MLDRVPPQNIEAEQSVLGSILIEQSAIAKISDILQPEDFYREAHKMVYRAAMTLFERGEAIDFITVIDTLRREESLERAGGISYITSLANGVPTAANIVFHAKIVQEKSLLRRKLRNLEAAGSVTFACAEDAGAVAACMDLTPRGIREHLSLTKPIYARTSAYGHFGRAPEADGGFSWEKTDLVEALKAAV